VRIALAVNPTAGRGFGARSAPVVAERLRAGGHEVRVLQAAGAQALADRVTGELAAGAQALVVVGGDGMVHLGVNAVTGTGVPLGIVAAGTGNDAARTLGLPLRDAVAAAEQLVGALATPARRVDVGRCEPGGRHWFCVLSAGFDSLVNERANRWRWPRNRLRYDLATLCELPVLRPREYAITMDGDTWQGPALLACVANGPSFGGGMQICPPAVLDDGLLDVVLVRPLSRREFVRLYPRVYSGRHLEHAAVEVFRARTVRIAGEDPIGYADGERIGPLPLTLTVQPGALSVLAR
jgi:diacylglycerol kinase (ATP)